MLSLLGCRLSQRSCHGGCTCRQLRHQARASSPGQQASQRPVLSTWVAPAARASPRRRSCVKNACPGFQLSVKRGPWKQTSGHSPCVLSPCGCPRGTQQAITRAALTRWLPSPGLLRQSPPWKGHGIGVAARLRVPGALASTEHFQAPRSHPSCPAVLFPTLSLSWTASAQG